jgi:hypothetical protein
MPLQIGTILNGRYRILSVLGQGGFGAVYRAADMTLKRPCAVKENLDTSPEAERQFEKEAIVLAQLSHPNLPRVQDHFMIPGQGQYLVMDFIEGQDLQTIVQQSGRVDPDTALDWTGQIAGALAYLHAQKPPIIHRDIKPANIRVTSEGKAFLVDFGLVKVYDPHLRTTVGARAITPGYSPPEQYGQGNTDVRTDIYALGATLYTLLTGLEPQESVQRVVEDHLIPLQAANPRVQQYLGQAVGKAMDLRPSQRYKTISEFEKALETSGVQADFQAETVQMDRQAMTVQVAPAEPVPAAVEVPAVYPADDVDVVPAKKPFLRQPWIYLGLVAVLALCAFMVFAGYQMLKPEETKATDTLVVSNTPDRQATQTSQARGTATKLAADAAAAKALTEAAPRPTNTTRPTALPPTQAPTETEGFTETPTRTFTPIPTETINASPTPCFYVIDSWCLSHEGCANMKVNNATNSVATIHIWSNDGSINSTNYYPVGICYFQIRPGTYNYAFDYCGQHSEGRNPLNQGWWIKFSCP